ncbi:MAG: hypothetical protein ACRCWF_02110 [Beijerinckiaceae bacterium]
MPTTAYARLEQFRIDIEKLMAEKEIAETNSDPETPTGEQESANPNEYPGGTAQDAAIETLGKNLFKSLDDALAVLN